MFQPRIVLNPSTTSQQFSADEQLARRVASFLSATVGPAATDITLGVRQGQVVLRGNVSSLAVKSQLETHSRRVAGVLSVVNQLRVAPRAEQNPATLTRPYSKGGTGRAPAAVADLQIA